MLRVWGRSNSINVQKVMWTLGELGLPHERIDVGGEHAGLDTSAYGALNPNRRIPTLEDDRFVLWESNVIVRYLAAKHGAGSLWPTDLEERAVADQWMDWQQTTLLPDMRTLFWGLVRTAPERRDLAAIDAAAKSLASIWQRLAEHLTHRSFVVGERFTMGDIPVGAMYHRYHALGVAEQEPKSLAVWYERLEERPAYRAHVMLPLS
ncbi:MAG TPA: glutathione S-transferase family protein [Myxococcota bacterium]|nr:glutathione S-transferase family protein [Myxococcota bacterium]